MAKQPGDIRTLRITGHQKGASVERLTGQAGDIMQAARALFERKGVRGTSVTAIAVASSRSDARSTTPKDRAP